MKFQCLECLGIYDDILPDGMAYYHVCPKGKITGDLLALTREFVPFTERRNEVLVEENPGSIKSEGKGRVLLKE